MALAFGSLDQKAVYVDQTNDDAITETLKRFREARQSCSAAVVAALRPRFLDNGIADAEWREIENRVDAENIGLDDASLRAAFRRELTDLCARVGLPRGIVPRGYGADAIAL